MGWHRRVPGFFVSLLVTSAAVSAMVATDWPRGAAALLGTIGGPVLGVWWRAVIGLVLGLFTSLVCGLFTYLGGGWVVGLMAGGLVGSSIGSGLLRDSSENVAFGVTALVGIVCGMGLLAARINAMTDEWDRTPSGAKPSGFAPPMTLPPTEDDEAGNPPDQ